MSDDDEKIDGYLSGKPVDTIAKREKLMKKISKHYLEQNDSRVVKVDVKNIVIIGRSRTGKSTIKSMLVDPRDVPDDLTLRAGTRDPSVESFFIDGKNLMLNIIDTPGVFEHQTEQHILRDNETIMKGIEVCINLEITKFHLICFAFSMPAGIQSDDIEALKLFIDRLGPEVSQNSCLIITRAETKTAEQRRKLLDELVNDCTFKQIGHYFKRGIFFTGSINHDDFQAGNSSIIYQYMTVLEYRKELLREFAANCEPFQINQSYISEIRRIQEQYEKKYQDLQSTYSTKLQSQLAQKEHERLLKQADDERKRAAERDKGCSVS